jgi:hypothetical protein
MNSHDINKNYSEEEERLNFFFFLNHDNPKTFLFPLSCYSSQDINLVNVYRGVLSRLGDNDRIIYISDIFGPRMLLTSRNPLSLAFKNTILEEAIEIPSNVEQISLNPIETPQLTREIVKQIFAFKSQDKRKAIVGEEIKYKKVLKKLIEISGKELKNKEIGPIKKISAIYDAQVIVKNPDIFEAFERTIKWFKKNYSQDYLEKYYLSAEDHQSSAPWKNTRKPGLKITTAFKTNIASYVSNKVIHAITSPKIGRFLETLKEKSIAKLEAKTNRKNEVLKKRERHFGKIVFGLSVIASVVIVPIALFSMSLALVLLGENQLLKGRVEYSKRLFMFSEKTSSVSSAQLYFYSKMPLLGGKFSSLAKYSDFVSDASKIAYLGVGVIEKATYLANEVIKGEKFDVDNSSKLLSLDLDDLYKQISFFEGELDDSGFKDRGFLSKYLNNLDLESRREEIAAAEVIISNLGELLGSSAEKTYLILMQNNMELRPTGGFVGSFALVKFNGGGLKSIDVLDVYSADGQLKGYVEPPWQINKYLGEAGWYLRDSNWDPDFPTSAQRAEWFLDKEMEIRVDGVLAIDLSLAKDLIGVVGPLYIADFDKTIDKNNFYEVVQYEAEKDFFPGSRKKENFLTALSGSLLSRVKTIGEKDYLPFFEAIYSNLNQRHVQVFIHDASVQKELARVGWDGSFKQDGCRLNNCVSDWVGTVEANFGVNKANYFIERQNLLQVNIGRQSIQHQLVLTLKNNAPPALNASGKYKVYIRLVAPKDAVLDDVVVKQTGESVSLKPDVELVSGRKEAGVLVEIDPGQKKDIVYSWKMDWRQALDKNGEYRFYFRKQAGIDSIPMKAEFSFPGDLRVAFDSKENESLTDDGLIRYNLGLSQDFKTRIYW